MRSRQHFALSELAAQAKAQSYQSDPVKWLEERFGEKISLVDWTKYGGYDNHTWDGTANPFYEMCKALANKKHVGVESATGTGKTYMLPRVIYWFLDTYPDSLVVTTAPKKEQLKRVLWNEISNAFPRFKKIRPHAELFSLTVNVDKRKQVIKAEKNEQGFFEKKGSGSGWEAIGIVAGVGSGEESATKMQGFHRKNMLFVIEECAGVHHAVITAITNTCTGSNNLIVAVGNPDSELDALHLFCNRAGVINVRISAYDHPNIVLKKELIPGAVTVRSVEERRDEYGEDSPFYKSRVRGIAPTESVDSLIKGDYFDQCTKGHPKFEKVAVNKKFFYNACGVDVANSEAGDAAAVCFGRGNVCDYIKEFQCPNATHLAYNLIMDDMELAKNGYKNYDIPTVKQYEVMSQNIGVDAVGIGVATVNALHDKGYKATSLLGGQMEYAVRTGTNGEDLYKFNNLRSQMYFEAREDLRLAEIVLDLPPTILRKLKRELITIKYKVQGGKIVVEAKEEIKKRIGKSPNLADAFVYWNWCRKGYYLRGQHLPFM